MINNLKKNIISDRKYIVESKTSLKNVIQKFNTQSNKIIFILKDKRLVGSITDGDIRRKFIKNMSVNDDLNKFYNKNPLYIELEKINQKQKIIFAKKNYIQIIPVIGKNKNYLGFIKTKDFIKEKNLVSKKFDIVIMAGGFGKRLLPITKKIPKPLIKIDGEPVINKLIESFRGKNINKIYLVLHYKAKLIKKHVLTNFPDLKNNFEFIVEKKPLDTAGGLKLIDPKKSSKTYMLINSDIITNINFEDFYNFYKKNNADLAACTTKSKFTIPFGVLQTRNKKIKYITEKPIFNFWINSGIYFLNQSIIKLIKKNEKISAVELMKRSIKKNRKIIYYPIYENWIDIGSHTDLIKAKNNF
tara:strand:+ start:42309 stop:43382 length:1074 start_codon:yes stop_codon:yes gene_type:complete